MKVGGELLDILEMFKRNQQQIDLLTANNMQLASYLQQAGIIQNYGGLPALLQPAEPHHELGLRRPRGRPPMKSLMGMGVPVEAIQSLGGGSGSAPNVDGVDTGPSKVSHTRLETTSGGNNRYIKVYANDPDGKYYHRKDGSIVIMRDGRPRTRREGRSARVRRGWTAERRAEFSAAQKERMARLTKKEKQELVAKRLETLRQKKKSEGGATRIVLSR